MKRCSRPRGCAQSVTAEDQVRLIRCDGWVIGIHKITAVKREFLGVLVLAVTVGRPIKAPCEFLAGLSGR